MEETLDLGYLFSILKKHLVIIIIVGIISGAAGFSGAYFLIPKNQRHCCMWRTASRIRIQ